MERYVPRARLDTVGRHLRGATEPSAGGSATTTQQQAPGGSEGLPLLSDAQVKQFVVSGYLVVNVSDMPASWHEAAYEKARRISGETSNAWTLPQDGFWAGMSGAVSQVVRSRAVCGALTSLLGRDYLFSAGGHMHLAGEVDQTFHVRAAPRPLSPPTPHHIHAGLSGGMDRKMARATEYATTNPRA